MSWKPHVKDKILVVHDAADPTELKEYTVKSLNSEGGFLTVVCEGHANIFYEAVCFPASVKDELLEILSERKRLKEAYVNSAALLYKLRNKLAQEGAQP